MMQWFVCDKCSEELSSCGSVGNISFLVDSVPVNHKLNIIMNKSG